MCDKVAIDVYHVYNFTCLDSGRVFDGFRDCADGSDEGAELCGNGVVDVHEECDDANILSNDGCSGICNIEAGYHCVSQGSANGTSVCTNIPLGTTLHASSVEFVLFCAPPFPSLAYFSDNYI